MRTTDLGQMCQIGPAADVHVNAGDGQCRGDRRTNAVRELFVPDAVFGLFAACIGLLTMPMAEAGIDSQHDIATRSPRSELVNHLRRAAIDRNIQLDDEFQRLAVKTSAV